MKIFIFDKKSDDFCQCQDCQDSRFEGLRGLYRKMKEKPKLEEGYFQKFLSEIPTSDRSHFISLRVHMLAIEQEAKKITNENSRHLWERIQIDNLSEREGETPVTETVKYEVEKI